MDESFAMFRNIYIYGYPWSITQTRATMVVCVECLPADKPWDVVSVTRRSSGVAPRACVRVYARVLVPPNLYIHTCMDMGFIVQY